MFLARRKLFGLRLKRKNKEKEKLDSIFRNGFDDHEPQGYAFEYMLYRIDVRLLYYYLLCYNNTNIVL